MSTGRRVCQVAGGNDKSERADHSKAVRGIWPGQLLLRLSIENHGTAVDPE